MAQDKSVVYVKVSSDTAQEEKITKERDVTREKETQEKDVMTRVGDPKANSEDKMAHVS